MKAFPFKDHIEGQYGQSDGMDLRDYFAAKVITTLLSSSYNLGPTEAVEKAYRYADLMLLVRKV